MFCNTGIARRTHQNIKNCEEVDYFQPKLDLKQPDRNQKLAFDFGFGLAENGYLIFCSSLGYAEISCLAETESSVELFELFGSFLHLATPQGCAGHCKTVLDNESLSSTFFMTEHSRT